MTPRRPSAIDVLLGIVCAAITMNMPTHAQSQTAPGQHELRLQATLQRDVDLSYLLFLPRDYASPDRASWPLIVFLHGAGERGTNLQRVAVHGPPKLVKERPDFPFVVLSPQCPDGETWDVEALDLLLSRVLANHKIDPQRVYLTGLSMGGYGTWAWLSQAPERFAAAVPICGGGEPVSVWLAGGTRRQDLSRIPIRAFHGARDSVVPLSESQRMVDAYQRIGNTVKLTVYPDADHDSWSATYANQELWDWLLQQRRP